MVRNNYFLGASVIFRYTILHRNSYRVVTDSKSPTIIMSGRGKGGKAKAKAKTRSYRAGLLFPVGRVQRFLRKGHYMERIGSGAPVFLAAVLESLVAEILKEAGNSARANKKARIVPRHIQLAVRNHKELNKLLSGVTIGSHAGGVLDLKEGRLGTAYRNGPRSLGEVCMWGGGVSYLCGGESWTPATWASMGCSFVGRWGAWFVWG